MYKCCCIIYDTKCARSRAVATIGASGALHRSPRTRGPRIATFYCKIFTLKAKENLLLFCLESTHVFFSCIIFFYMRFFVVAYLGPFSSRLVFSIYVWLGSFCS